MMTWACQNAHNKGHIYYITTVAYRQLPIFTRPSFIIPVIDSNAERSTGPATAAGGCGCPQMRSGYASRPVRILRCALRGTASRIGALNH